MLSVVLKLLLYFACQHQPPHTQSNVTSRLAVAVFAPVNPAGIVWVLVASHLYLYKISVKKSVVLGKCS